MASPIPQELDIFLSVQHVIIFPISTLSVMYFVYGVYILLFGTYLYMLQHGERLDITVAANTLYLGLTITLFVLSTTFVVVETILYVGDTIALFNGVKTGDLLPLAMYFLPDNLGRVALVGLESLVPVLLNIAADWMLIHRCYTIWSFNKRIGIPLMLAAVIVNSMGVITAILLMYGLINDAQLYRQANVVNATYNVCSAAINLITTLLTAGRIWWAHQQVRAHGAYSKDRLVQSVCRIIIESGILYPLFQTAALIAANTSNETTFPFEFGPIGRLVAGVAPTIIMVRGKLGKNVESLKSGEVFSDIQFSSRRVTNSTGHGQVQSLNIAFTEVDVEAREKAVVC